MNHLKSGGINIYKYSLLKAVCAAIVMSGIVTATSGCKSTADGPTILPPIPVRVATVESSEQKITKRFSGYTYPWEAHGVGFLIGGRVTSILVEEGGHVKKGDTLATINPDDYALVQQLSAAQVDAIKPNYERVLGLIKDDALPKAKLDEVEGMYKAAVTMNKQAERQVSYTKLKAPIDGIVMSKGTSVGQVIGPGMPAVIVLNISKIKVNFGVTQKELGLFSIGTEVNVSFQGFPDQVKGVVHNIALVPDVTTRMYELTVAIDNPDEKFRPGMLSRIELNVKQAEGFFIPLRAIKRNSQQQHVVYLVGDDDIVLERKVTIGDLYSEQIQITEGLKGGEKLIVDGQAFANPGEKVKVL